jgi:hypothetical protein
LNRDDALNRIRKCLALSGSSNANEAAIALRQAQKLMNEFSIDMAAIHAPKIGDLNIAANGKTVTAWEASLAATVAATLGIRVYINRSRGKQQTCYFGNVDRVALAEYAHESLRRAIIKARKEYVLLQSFTGQYNVKELRALGKSFAIGFAMEVKHAVSSLFETPEEKAANDQWLSERGLIIRPARKVRVNSRGLDDGRAAGDTFKINRPIHGNDGGVRAITFTS